MVFQPRVASEIVFKNIEAWRVSMDLVVHCYTATRNFPRDELYGLSGQLRRATVSIPSNIAEGHGRRTTKCYAHHVSIALGSHAEIETCLEIAARLGYLDQSTRDALSAKVQSVGRLLHALHRSLKEKLRRNDGHN